MNAETQIGRRKNADVRGIEGATMTGAEMSRIRKKCGLSIYELAALLRYRDVDGLRKMEARDAVVSGPIQLAMEMLDDGRLNPDQELAETPAIDR
jgi:DNA-binding transcriptional regulator YiaG